MITSSTTRPLPLRVSTPQIWAEEVLKEPLTLLNDHAHLEKKASQNALQLLHQWPERQKPQLWTEELSEISRDESQHLSLVLKILHRRGGTFTRNHVNPYAKSLREHIRVGAFPDELVDKLLVSSLIEARSCERFLLLSKTTNDRELQKLYHGLWSSEHDHYLVFLKLAESIANHESVTERWETLLDHEAKITSKQSPNISMHSWITSTEASASTCNS